MLRNGNHCRSKSAVTQKEGRRDATGRTIDPAAPVPCMQRKLIQDDREREREIGGKEEERNVWNGC